MTPTRSKGEGLFAFERMHGEGVEPPKPERVGYNHLVSPITCVRTYARGFGSGHTDTAFRQRRRNARRTIVPDELDVCRCMHGRADGERVELPQP